jgi:hypothetical protein
MYNNSANQHKHRLPNGSFAVHAHPFSKSQDNEPVKKHKHTANEFTLISVINNLFSFLIIVSIVFQRLKVLTQKKFIYRQLPGFPLTYILPHRLRAPPLM